MAKPLDTSSGDLLADRRADYAEMLFGSGEAAPAAELMLGALELAPGWAMGWFRLGEFHEAAGALDQAAEAWRMAQKLDPEDRRGRGAETRADRRRARCRPRRQSAFVETLFDQYAEKFDDALVKTLDYRVPEFLAEAIAAQGRKNFGLAIDLGCGTGLMGERLRPLAGTLDGYDISAEMLRKARAKGVYDRLVKADLQSLPTTASKPISSPPPTCSCMSARSKASCKPSPACSRPTDCSPSPSRGLPATAISRSSPRAAMRIRRPMSRRCSRRERLRPLSLEMQIIRQDRREPVEGLIVVAEPLPSWQPDPGLFQNSLGGLIRLALRLARDALAPPRHAA